MNALPFVGVSTSKEGVTNVLIRQSANDGQYAVEICLDMEQFSGLMAVLRGLEMYLMDMELRKPDPTLLTTFAEPQAGIGEDHLSILYNKENIGTQTSKKKARKRKLETIQEEDKRDITDQM